ncbi:phosphate transporter PhoU [Pyrococcus furiosus DSM 3638]|uniref:Phosphate transporter PhoU n=3 Tax=Pyrococcus furiosus TaxID=2261 RepID=A0A5C0XPP1_PYRFU|nr:MULTISPECIES: PhoU domain-containing protein [Pyrococcus]AAL81133.1 hypothetical protein PF1009 [Pyrococcus furiosus DSM 3638]AFN03804.1 hypothetical protein PFC_04275 [Pyrococcus furiosus COM1]MDK2870054.1 phosphate transport system protein [Pyrococcus sp.]QEK78672.1 phosphate transporter PhoU [Pyrococcus furiosus DSM 3638]
MKKKALEKARNLLKTEGDYVINSMELLNTEAREEIENILWEVAYISENLNDILIEILLRYHPMATELRFVRSALNVNYDLYRMMRHLSRIEVLLKLHKSEEQGNLIEEAMKLFRPWVLRGIEALTEDKKIPIDELPFFEFEFNELWSSYIRTKDPYVVGTLIHLESFFSYVKNILRSAVYYFLGSRGVEETPMLYLV